VQLALTREIARFLGSGRAGAVVVAGGASGVGGDAWLARLVRTADPAARAKTTDAELAAAPADTVLDLGSVDAAYDMRDRSLADLRRYLGERFDVPERNLHRGLRPSGR
jgi:hypothetical protein